MLLFIWEGFVDNQLWSNLSIIAIFVWIEVITENPSVHPNNIGRLQITILFLI